MKRFLINLIKKDWWMKLAAIGLAALLWLFVIALENPTRVKTFEDIPVTYVGVEQLSAKGLCLSDDIEDIVSSVDVSVEAQTEVLQYVDEDNITATLDFSDISVAGDYTLTIKARSSSGKVTEVSPHHVDVTVETLATKELPVEVQVIGNKLIDLYYGDVSLSEDTVTVAGSKTDIDKLVKAIITVDVTDKTESFRESKTVTLLAEDGNIISSDNYNGVLPSVIVEMEIYPTLILPVDKDALIAGVSGIAEGYEISSVSLSQSEVVFAGPQDILDSVQLLSYEKVDLNDAAYDATMQIGIDIPEGVIASVPEKLTVTFHIEEIKEEKVFEGVAIKTKNLKNGYVCTLSPDKTDITVRGTKEFMKNISDDDIIPYVDLSGLELGVHTAILKFEKSDSLGVEITPAQTSVEITIKRK